MVRCCCQRSFLPIAAISVAFIVTANSWLTRNIAAGHYGFSQFAQDSFVLELLGHKRGGVFVDVGASDGIWNSNSYLLEGYYGWRGVCVEPGARQRLLAWLRPRCINVMAPMSSTEQLVEFHKSARTAEHSGIVATTTHQVGSNVEGSDVVRVRTSTINATLTAWRERLWPSAAPAVVDYLSVDTEGHEFEALRGFPFDRVRLRVVTVEQNKAKKEVDKLLHAAGMRLAGTIVTDDVWVTSMEPSLVKRARAMLASGPPARSRVAAHVSPRRTRWRERKGLIGLIETRAKEALPSIDPAG